MRDKTFMLHMKHQGEVAEGIQTKGDQGQTGRRGEHPRENCGEEIIEKYPLFSCCYSQKGPLQNILADKIFAEPFTYLVSEERRSPERHDSPERRSLR